MKKLVVAVIAAVACAPVFAFAQTTDTPESLNRILTVAAALEAQIASLQSRQPLACAVLFGKPSVRVHENVALAWGSVGAVDPQVSSTSQSMWAPHGVSTLSFTQAGTWKYSFTFYGETGASTTCDAFIRVVQ